jgi:hypothetical protein
MWPAEWPGKQAEPGLAMRRSPAAISAQDHNGIIAHPPGTGIACRIDGYLRGPELSRSPNRKRKWLSVRPHPRSGITLSDTGGQGNAHTPADLYWNNPLDTVRWRRAERADLGSNSTGL